MIIILVVMLPYFFRIALSPIPFVRNPEEHPQSRAI